MKARFQSLIDTVDAACHETAIRQAIGDFARRLGFQRFAYFRGIGLEIKAFSNYPSAWAHDYINKGYSAIDPVVWQAKQLKRAFLWNAESWTEEPMSDAVRGFAEDAIRHGLRAGLTIPVEGSFGRTLMLTLAGKGTDQFELPVDSAALASAVLAIHYNLLRVADDALLSAGKILTPQECLCLQWSSRGLRKFEIARVMELAPRTVQEYLDRARQKLEASTLAHAVAIGKEKKLF
jgi:LuxR family transcriptional regulator, activator of conjugal transfer of Ti plasmids